MIAGWSNRRQQQVIAHLLEKNRTLHAKLGDRRLRSTDCWTRAKRAEAMRGPVSETIMISRAECLASAHVFMPLGSSGLRISDS
jgi:hypothetical protein